VVKRLDDDYRRGVRVTATSACASTSSLRLGHHLVVLPDGHDDDDDERHVDGDAARHRRGPLLQNNPAATPQQVRDGLFNLTTKNIVTDAGSANAHLLFSNM
jgi:hypothetical protein